jgi:hypothetical protein
MPNILRGVPISMDMIGASWATKTVLVLFPYSTTTTATFAGIWWWDFFDWNPCPKSFILNKRLKLIVAPSVSIISGIGLVLLPLFGGLPDARQIF